LIVSVGRTQKPFSRTVCSVAAILLLFIAREARLPDYFFVLGINTSADAQLNRAARHKQKYRCGRAEGCNNAETITFVSRTTLIMSLS
jgi:hypothetical protein